MSGAKHAFCVCVCVYWDSAIYTAILIAVVWTRALLGGVLIEAQGPQARIQPTEVGETRSI